MSRWALVLPLVFLGGLPAADDKERPAANGDNKPGDKKGARPLIDVDAFLREYDRDKDGYLTKDEMPDWLHYNFSRLDTNKDGKISREELTKGMAHLQQRRRPSDVVLVLVEMSDCDEGCGEEVQRAYEFLFKLDKNKDGKLDADELKAGRELLVTQRVEGILKRLDTDKDGKISKQEAKGLIREDFAKLDKNGDGFVDRDELTAAVSARHTEGKEKSKARDEKK